MKLFRDLLQSEEGASAAEYALLVAIMGSTIALAAVGVGNVVANSMNGAGNLVACAAVC